MSEVLSNLSDALAEIVAHAGLSVVRVEARPRLPGTGVIWSADGTIVTAHHVVERDEGLKVGLPGGQTTPATFVGRDPTTDLAVLKAQASGLTTTAWATPDEVKVGHLTLALGRPGESVRATLGIVSALGDSWVAPTGGRIDRYLQTDVAMYPGFSGGPLLDSSGRVLGLNTSALLRGVSLAIPTPTVRRVVETLLAHGRVRRGYLGVTTQSVRLPSSLAQQLGQETGLLIVSVASGSPAESAGLVMGDAITSIGGKPVRFMDDLLAALSGAQIGATTQVRVIRGGQVRELSVTIGEHP